MKKRINRRSMRKSVKFRPSHEFLEKAVEDYLAKGGVITKIVLDEKAFENFVSTGDPVAVDEFLNGQ